MKVFIKVLLCCLLCLLSSCGKQDKIDNRNLIRFATSATYPPFEYLRKGELQGFDIELGKLIARELGKEAVFVDLQFSGVLPALVANQADAAIATLTITAERQKNFDFSVPYYFAGMAAVYKQGKPISNLANLLDKKVSAQLGSTMEIWLKQHVDNQQITAMDDNNLAIESLKAGHLDVVLLDEAQAQIFSSKNPGLAYSTIAQSKDGYAVALPKNSVLTAKINQALVKLEKSGKIQQLHKSWLENVNV